MIIFYFFLCVHDQLIIVVTVPDIQPDGAILCFIVRRCKMGTYLQNDPLMSTYKQDKNKIDSFKGTPCKYHEPSLQYTCVTVLELFRDILYSRIYQSRWFPSSVFGHLPSNTLPDRVQVTPLVMDCHFVPFTQTDFLDGRRVVYIGFAPTSNCRVQYLSNPVLV